MTNNKQQSSVEWLIEKCACAYLRPELWEIIKQQAKEMHKEEIEDAFWNGDNTDCTSEQNIKDFAKQYYNETYGGDEQ